MSNNRVYFSVLYAMAIIFSLEDLGLRAQALASGAPGNPLYAWAAEWFPALLLLTAFIVLGWGLGSLFKR